MFNPGNIVCGKYKIIREIGRGGMWIIYEAVGPSGSVAVKVPNLTLNPPDVVVERLKIERDVLKRLSHPHIVKYVDECDEGQIPVLVVELIKGSGLENFEGRLDVDTALKLGVKLAEALHYLHRNNIIHRDFCIKNVMLRNNNPEDPVVIDMGMAKMGMNKALDPKGTKIAQGDCSPPELAFYGIAMEASDIYMWGTILMKVVKRRGQWRGLSDIMTPTPNGPAIRGRPCDYIECGSYTNVLNKVLAKALDPDYTKRYPSVDELLRELIGMSPPPKSGAYLYVSGTKIQLMPNEDYIIGREGHIKIDDPDKYVSGRHARIRYDKGTNSWVVEDLCSTNGTLVIRGNAIYVVYEGHRGKGARGGICGRMELQSGDVIALAFKQSNPHIYHREVRFEYV